MTSRIEMRLRKLELKRGDTVVFEAPGEITFKTMQQLKDQFEKKFKKLGLKAIVLANGMKVAKVIPGKK